MNQVWFDEKQKQWTWVDLGVNLTVDGDHGQRDAYVENGEWDLEGIRIDFIF